MNGESPQPPINDECPQPPINDESPHGAGFGHQEIGRIYWRGDVRKKVSALWLPSLPDTPLIGLSGRRL
jgi:hypothetical protein